MMLQNHDVILKMIYDIEQDIRNKEAEIQLHMKECNISKRTSLFKRSSFFLKYFRNMFENMVR
jgi:hypothetical protein